MSMGGIRTSTPTMWAVGIRATAEEERGIALSLYGTQRTRHYRRVLTILELHPLLHHIERSHYRIVRHRRKRSRKGDFERVQSLLGAQSVFRVFVRAKVHGVRGRSG